MPFIIENQEQYLDYLDRHGVGDNDTVPGATPRSYLSYLRAATKILNCSISAQLFPNLSPADFDAVCDRVKYDQQHAQYASGTRRNAISALRHYFDMVAGNH
ncbi:MAG: hypothetical protein ACR2QC_05150 [Gammaproteobacteria bacterium]